MKVAAVIAEYNPFHNGHAYQLQKLKQETQADYILVIMSGNFVQRGTPAIMDKYMRTDIALHCGADLVIELPVLFSCSSAEFFASGSIAMLNALNCVDYLGFGCENVKLDTFNQIAAILNNEPLFYKNTLKSFLKKGLSFPKARENALKEYIKEYRLNIDSIDSFIHSPNNILAIEYLRQINSTGSRIKPVGIQRLGADYKDSELNSTCSSASAIRQILQTGNPAGIRETKKHMPQYAYHKLSEEYLKTFPVINNDFSLLLKYKLLLESDHDYQCYLDVCPDFSQKIKKQLHCYEDFDSFIKILKSKDITYTRICRDLLHILLNIKNEDIALIKKEGYAQYAHILGFRKNSLPLLKAMKKNCLIPLFATSKDIQKHFSTHKEDISACKTLLETDKRANGIYNSVVQSKFGFNVPDDFQKKFLKI